MVIIYSSFSKDIILNYKGKVLSAREGGPAFFIQKVFDKYKFSYILKTDRRINVEIRLTEGKERGRIKEFIGSKKIDSRNSSQPILISTIGKEWILSSNFNAKTQIFLDVQGYVRNLRFFGKKKPFKADFLENVFCIKGTAEELKWLPLKIFDNQKKKCLVITSGAKGAIIYYGGKKFVFRPAQKLHIKMAIGAGDTFFASFVMNFIKTNGNVPISGREASKDASEFLKEYYL